MSKNQAWHSIGSSVAAGIITYFILEWEDSEWSPSWKIACIALVGLASFAIAFMTGRSAKGKPLNEIGRVKVGTTIRTKEGVEVSDIGVSETPEADVDIGTDINAGKKVKISGIKIGSKE